MSKLIVLLLLAVAIAPPAALAHSHKKKGLEIVHPWTPEMADRSVTTTSVFMKIKNRGRAADRLLGASSPTAARVELLEPAGDTLKPAAPVAIAAGADAHLGPSGPRLHLTGVRKQLHAYDTFKMTLVFEKAGAMEIEVMVEEAETAEPHKH